MILRRAEQDATHLLGEGKRAFPHPETTHQPHTANKVAVKRRHTSGKTAPVTIHQGYYRVAASVTVLIALLVKSHEYLSTCQSKEDVRNALVARQGAPARMGAEGVPASHWLLQKTPDPKSPGLGLPRRLLQNEGSDTAKISGTEDTNFIVGQG